jgi:tetratricopeptide (TPR) repeat protein
MLKFDEKQLADRDADAAGSRNEWVDPFRFFSISAHMMSRVREINPAGPWYLRRPVTEGDDAVYVRAIRCHLRNGNRPYAYRIVRYALEHFPDNALLLSYHGYLQAALDRRYRSGIESCRKALEAFRPDNAICAELAYPVLHLNLGRAYFASGRRREAIEALDAGLQYDRRHRELLLEQQRIGMRRRSPMPFLSRSNPINKYIGIMLRSPAR